MYELALPASRSKPLAAVAPLMVRAIWAAWAVARLPLMADPVMPEPPAGRTWNVLPAEKLKLGAARMLTGKNSPNNALVEVSTNPLA